MRLSIEQLGSLAEVAFRERVVQVLATVDPAALAALRSEAGQRTLSQLIERAGAHGMTSELDIGRFIISAWILGADFDTRFPAMREILAEPRMTARQKADALEKLTTTLMNKLHQGRKA